MAKSKPEPINDDVTFLGEAVDPEIQKKVDSYMELDEEEQDASTGKKVEVAIDDEINDEAVTEPEASAPLLPTDKLPDSVTEQPAPKVKKIAVSHEASSAPELPADVGGSKDEELPLDEKKDSSDEGESDEEVAEPIVSPIAVTVADEDEDEPEEQDTVEPLADDTVDTEDDVELEKSPAPEPEVLVPNIDDVPDYTGKTLADMDAASVPDVPELDDRVTREAIDEIIAADADKLLGIEDAKLATAKPVEAKKHPKAAKSKAKRRNFFAVWFKTPLYRNLTILAVLAIIAGVIALPDSRYYVLNSAGVRVSTSLKVYDEGTGQPLKNVEVRIDDKSTKSDGEGLAKLEGVKLGEQELVISKPAFAEVKKSVVLGWGSNPLDNVDLKAVGMQYIFEVKNFLSEKPITDGEVSFGEATAKINEKGEAVLAVPNTSEESIPIDITAPNYRSETVTVSTTAPEPKYVQKMVPSGQQVFFSKRSGTADLYKIDVDGKNEELLLAGTGLERDDSLGVAPHPTKPVVVFSSSRENVRNKDGYLLNTLQLMDLETKQITRLAQSERVQIIDWVGDRIVYVKIAEGASQASETRHQLVSYDVESRTETELASTNYFNDIVSVNGAIYYSPALYNVNGKVGLYKINPDGSGKKTVFTKEVWNIFRISYEKLSVSVGQDWYELNLANDELVKVAGAPSVLRSRVYVASPDGKTSVWLDERDGKSVLIRYDHETKKEDNVISFSGMKSPLRWIDNEHVVFRLANGQETADYVVHVRSGQSSKIADVTNSYGIDRWYYF